MSIYDRACKTLDKINEMEILTAKIKIKEHERIHTLNKKLILT